MFIRLRSSYSPSAGRLPLPRLPRPRWINDYVSIILHRRSCAKRKSHFHAIFPVAKSTGMRNLIFHELNGTLRPAGGACLEEIHQALQETALRSTIQLKKKSGSPAPANRASLRLAYVPSTFR